MNESQLSIPVNMDREEVGHLFENYNLNSACVVDKNNKLVVNFTPTQEERREKKIKLENYNWKTQKKMVTYYPYKLKNNVGYFELTDKQIEDMELYIQLVDRPSFTKTIQKIQDAKIIHNSKYKNDITSFVN